MKRDKIKKLLPILIYFAFIGASFFAGYLPGQEIGKHFADFGWELLKVIPCAFILIGLFEVWIKDETVKKHLGDASGFKGHLWAILLSGTTVGGIYVAFPVAFALHSKGARLSTVFTYLGASALCRIPMTIFEASFLGIKFSLIRLLVSLPLVVITSMFLGRTLEKRNYRFQNGR